MSTKTTIVVKDLLSRIDDLPIPKADRALAKLQLARAEAASNVLLDIARELRHSAAEIRRTLAMRQHRHG
jgi:hypothetical protein